MSAYLIIARTLQMAFNEEKQLLMRDSIQFFR
jgi:hypothetical protein